VNPPPVPQAPRQQSFAGLAAGALALAIILPGFFSPLIFVSFGLITSAFVLAIVAITKGQPIGGALLIAACPLATAMAIGMMGIQDEVRKQRAEKRQEREYPTVRAERRASEAPLTPRPPPKPQWVRLTLDTDIYANEQKIPWAAGTRLKVVSKRGHDYQVEYEGGLYFIPMAITQPD
jgi:hypothetical protein